MRRIILRNITPTNPSNKVRLTIYYKNKRTKDLILRNDSSPRPSNFDSVNVIYKFTCPYENCTSHSSYIGLTTTKLSRRLSYHLSQGGPKRHLLQEHNIPISRTILEENTEIMDQAQDKNRLLYLEALYIKRDNPAINTQQEAPTALPSIKPFRRITQIPEEGENHRR